MPLPVRTKAQGQEAKATDMNRFLILFVVIAVIALAMMAAVLSQYGYSLFDSEMRIMLGMCVLVAAYVAWRVSTVLKNREQDLADRPAPGGAGKGKLAALFAPRSKALQAREAELAARRKRLVEEGKLDPEEDPTPAPNAPAEVVPDRAPPSASLKDKMAARAERVRRAKEQGKLD